MDTIFIQLIEQIKNSLIKVINVLDKQQVQIENLNKITELQNKEIQTLIKFVGKEQYIRFKNKGLNYRG